MLVAVIWVEGAVVLPAAGEDALRIAMDVADCVVPATNLPTRPGCSLSTPVSTMAMLIPLPDSPRSHAPTG